MIARIRGEHDTRFAKWRPVPRGGDAAPVGAPPRARGGAEPGEWRRWLWAVCAVGATIAAVSIAVSLTSPKPVSAQLPATPRAWLDAYEAAAIDNPSHVCVDLFAPQLAKAYGKALHSTCRRYFARISSFSVVVRRVLLDGGTAVLELHQTVRPRDWAVVLSHRAQGWQAVDLVAGSLVR